jgi:hypothetical protein
MSWMLSPDAVVYVPEVAAGKTTLLVTLFDGGLFTTAAIPAKKTVTAEILIAMVLSFPLPQIARTTI